MVSKIIGKTVQKISFLALLLAVCLPAAAQNIGINTSGTTPNSSAILDLNTGNNWATNPMGFLMPCMTTTQMNAISSPASGLLIYNTTTSCVMAYTSGTWQSVWCCTSPSAPATPVNSGCASGSNNIYYVGQASATYSIAAVSGATSYNWASSNTSVFTIVAGSTTCAITPVATGTATLSVSATNSCGTSSTSSVAITVENHTTTFVYTGTTVSWWVPACVTIITVTITGAPGGSNSVAYTAGNGATISGTISVTPGDQLRFLVGGTGATCTLPDGGGGGGGSYIWDQTTGTILAVAGGGGGCGGNLSATNRPGDVGQTSHGTLAALEAATTNSGNAGSGVSCAPGGSMGSNINKGPGSGGAGWKASGVSNSDASGTDCCNTGGSDTAAGGTGFSSGAGNGGYGGGGGGGCNGGGGGSGYNGGGGGNGKSANDGYGGGGGGSYWPNVANITSTNTTTTVPEITITY